VVAAAAAALGVDEEALGFMFGMWPGRADGAEAVGSKGGTSGFRGLAAALMAAFMLRLALSARPACMHIRL
jgi:hypothetical protein